MTRIFAAIMFSILAALGTGCRMCKQGYDYCGPAYGPNVYPYGFMGRRGSILGGDPTVVPSYASEPPAGDPQPTPAAIEPPQFEAIQPMTENPPPNQTWQPVSQHRQ
ncbi:MAG TPA: hypothetical protein VG713_04710 [Pirellulales bacterium]|nr:hypothetical protein [Pirellulales bacterium]